MAERAESKRSKSAADIRLEDIPMSKLREYRDAFRHFDKDGDGHISVEELGSVMRALGGHPTKADLKNMIKEVDINGDGSVEFEEFVKLMTAHLYPDEEETDLQETFYVFDKDRDGFITVNELREVMRSLGETATEDDLEKMMSEVDMDGDGKIDLQEFLSALTLSKDKSA